jgi:hypothetical protein
LWPGSAACENSVGAIAPRHVTIGGAGTSAEAASNAAPNALTVAAAARTRRPRRNRIVPKPDEPIDLDDESEQEGQDSMPFSADADDAAWEEVDDESEWEEDHDEGTDDGETASAANQTDDESEEDEFEEDDSQLIDAAEDETANEWEESEDEWAEDEELSKK